MQLTQKQQSSFDRASTVCIRIENQHQAITPTPSHVKQHLQDLPSAGNAKKIDQLLCFIETYETKVRLRLHRLV